MTTTPLLPLLPFPSIISFFSSSFLLQEDFQLIFLFSLLLIFFFLLCQPHFPSEKSKSWILTSFSSIPLSFFGLITLLRIESSGEGWNEDFIYGEDNLSRSVLLFFLSCTGLDLLLGFFFYPSQLHFFTTVVHHCFYLLFTSFLLYQRFSRGFLLCFLLEIPTAIMALGSLFPKQCRSDRLFGLSFLCTRVVFNAYLALRLYLLDQQHPMEVRKGGGRGGEGVIWKICLLVLAQHLLWFRKWVKQYGWVTWRKKKTLQSEEEATAENNEGNGKTADFS